MILRRIVLLLVIDGAAMRVAAEGSGRDRIMDYHAHERQPIPTPPPSPMPTCTERVPQDDIDGSTPSATTRSTTPSSAPYATHPRYSPSSISPVNLCRNMAPLVADYMTLLDYRLNWQWHLRRMRHALSTTTPHPASLLALCPRHALATPPIRSETDATTPPPAMATCSICWDPTSHRLDPCQHPLCPPCLDRLLAWRPHHRARCPLCRAPLVPTPPDAPGNPVTALLGRLIAPHGSVVAWVSARYEPWSCEVAVEALRLADLLLALRQALPHGTAGRVRRVRGWCRAVPRGVARLLARLDAAAGVVSGDDEALHRCLQVRVGVHGADVACLLATTLARIEADLLRML